MGFSWKDFILIAGGLFLVYKAVSEIHHKLEGAEEEHGGKKVAQITFGSVIAQILLLDIVFSLDSVITAVGMTENMLVIITVVVLSFGIMLFASRFIFTFVNKHPTVKMLALSFLLLIGVFLIAEGFGVHVDKALIYMPMAFAILVEALNLWAAARKAKRSRCTSRPCSCARHTPASTSRWPSPPRCRRARAQAPSACRRSRWRGMRTPARNAAPVWAERGRLRFDSAFRLCVSTRWRSLNDRGWAGSVVERGAQRRVETGRRSGLRFDSLALAQRPGGRGARSTTGRVAALAQRPGGWLALAQRAGARTRR